MNGIPKGLVNNSWNNFGPRLGFAYDLTGRGKTVIRGGFGMMYERIQGNDMYNGAVNPPGDPNPTLNNVALDNPGLSISGSSAGNVISAAQLPVLPLGVTGIVDPLSSASQLPVQCGSPAGMGTNAVLSISYVGSQGRHENYYQAINLASSGRLCRAEVTQLVLWKLHRDLTYPGYGNMRLAFNGANANYNSLQASLNGKIEPRPAPASLLHALQGDGRDHCHRQRRRPQQRDESVCRLEV